MQEHIRMSMLGTITGGEIFSFSIALGRHGQDGGDPGFLSTAMDPNSAVWADLAQDAVTFWNGCSAHVTTTLREVKFAPIGTDGLYAGPPILRPVGGVSGINGPRSEYRHANQVSLAVTLHSVGDLGRVKGRFYVPTLGLGVGNDGRIGEGIRDTLETNAQTFINNVNNQPGIDVLGIAATIASSGRRNADGSVKFPPKNWAVSAVSVGRVPDTIRSRRNKLNELRGTASPVS